VLVTGRALSGAYRFNVPSVQTGSARGRARVDPCSVYDPELKKTKCDVAAELGTTIPAGFSKDAFDRSYPRSVDRKRIRSRLPEPCFDPTASCG